MSMRTPLGQVRGLGSARTGPEHWPQQRLVAVLSSPLACALGCFVLGRAGGSSARGRGAAWAPWWVQRWANPPPDKAPADVLALFKESSDTPLSLALLSRGERR